MWEKIDASMFGELKPKETYIEYDGPRSYSTSHNGRNFYVHQCDEEIEYWDYFVREATEEELIQLEENKIQLRDFLEQAPTLYLVRMHGGDKPIEAFIVNPNDFSDAHFPSAGCYLTHGQKQDKDER